jgi:hypothetical protein
MTNQDWGNKEILTNHASWPIFCTLIGGGPGLGYLLSGKCLKKISIRTFSYSGDIRVAVYKYVSGDGWDPLGASLFKDLGKMDGPFENRWYTKEIPHGEEPSFESGIYWIAFKADDYIDLWYTEDTDEIGDFSSSHGVWLSTGMGVDPDVAFESTVLATTSEASPLKWLNVYLTFGDMVTFATMKAKTSSRKIVLVEESIGNIYSKWVNEGPGIWKGKIFYRKNTAYGFKEAGFLFSPFKQSGSGELTNEDYTQASDVGSVQEDGIELTEYDTYSDMYVTAGSWFFDRKNQLLYVHMTNDDWIHEHLIVVGIEVKITNDSVANDLGNGNYEERLIGVPTISKTKDSQTYGLIQHAGGMIEIADQDGKFDQILGMDYFGQPLIMKFGFEGIPYEEFITLTRGYIESAEFDWETIRFNLRDDRQKLSRKIPLNVFDQVTYPYLDDDNIGKPIPIFYGQVRNAPVICTNKNQGGSPAWVFKACDVSDHPNGIEEITTVYVDGIVVSPSATDLSAGTFTLANGDWDGQKQVTFDGKGLHDASDNYLTNPLDILTNLLSVYLLINYDTTNYDTTAWAAAKAHDLAASCGFFLDQPEEIISIIAGLCRSTSGCFVKLDGGKYTFRYTDIEASSSGTIRLNEFMEPTTIETDSDSLVTVIRIGYAKNYAANEYRYAVLDDRRSAIFSRYSKDNDIELETYLVNEADAIALGEHLYDLYDDSEPIVDAMTKSQYIDIEIMDVYRVEMLRASEKRIIPDFIGEVVKIDKNPLEATVSMRLRRLRDA